MSCCNNTPQKLLCHCFNISESAYQQSLEIGENTKITDFIIWQTKHNYCNCENLNPDKICCLKAFKQYKKQFENKNV